MKKLSLAEVVFGKRLHTTTSSKLSLGEDEQVCLDKSQLPNESVIKNFQPKSFDHDLVQQSPTTQNFFRITLSVTMKIGDSDRWSDLDN